ncbi:hypothetical protein LDENG_00118860 [Lucifuga dentata]|nr:hypothetical protein LDENG_00118860 [Lucifuga dentata]
MMACRENLVLYLSWSLIIGGIAYLLHQSRHKTQYGRYLEMGCTTCPARLAWFLQELPSFLLPLLLLVQNANQQQQHNHLGRTLLLCTFTLHYFQRTFIYAFLTRGRPVPVDIMLSAIIFCSLNGFLQGYFLLYCAHYEVEWMGDVRLATGVLLFVVGMIINIHSDHILRNLRTPGQVVYRIPHGSRYLGTLV